MTEAAVLDAARQHLTDLHNNPENLWAGGSKENQRRGHDFAIEYRRAERALTEGHKKEFDSALPRLEDLWHDPDPTGSKRGFKHLVRSTIKLLRNEFRKKWQVAPNYDLPQGDRIRRWQQGRTLDSKHSNHYRTILKKEGG